MPGNGNFLALLTAVARMGGGCLSDNSWMEIVDIQLFPILSFLACSQLWNSEKASTSKTVDVLFRKSDFSRGT